MTQAAKIVNRLATVRAALTGSFSKATLLSATSADPGAKHATLTTPTTALVASQVPIFPATSAPVVTQLARSAMEPRLAAQPVRPLSSMMGQLVPLAVRTVSPAPTRPSVTYVKRGSLRSVTAVAEVAVSTAPTVPQQTSLSALPVHRDFSLSMGNASDALISVWSAMEEFAPPADQDIGPTVTEYASNDAPRDARPAKTTYPISALPATVG